MKKKILIAAGLILALIAGCLTTGWIWFGGILKAANSVRCLEEGLYTLEFKGDYGFEEFLEGGGAASDAELASYITGFLSHGFYQMDAEECDRSFGCSTVYLQDREGNVRFGRNFDWEECSAMLVHTRPKNGYESISTACLDFLGFGEDYVPDAGISEKIMSLAAIYVPLDGMNEKGLMVADLLSGDDEVTHQDTGKPDLTTTSAIRLLLDNASTVDEACALLAGYDMHSSIGRAHHLAIADEHGRSVVVEYIGGEMKVTDAQIVTNHYLTEGEKFGIGSEDSHERYELLAELMKGASETEPKMLDLLMSVAASGRDESGDGSEKTMWSIVYNPTALTQDFYFAEQYDSEYRLNLYDMKYWVRYSGEEGDWLDALSINEWNKPEEVAD